MLLACKSSPFAASRRLPIAVQSVPEYHRPPSSLNLIRFSPNNLRLSSRYPSLQCTAFNSSFNLKPSKSNSLKCTALNVKPPKSDNESDIHIFQPNNNYEDPPTQTPPIWIFFKKCAIGGVMMVVLLMSNPVCSRAALGSRAFQSSPPSSASSSSSPCLFPAPSHYSSSPQPSSSSPQISDNDGLLYRICSLCFQLGWYVSLTSAYLVISVFACLANLAWNAICISLHNSAMSGSLWKALGVLSCIAIFCGLKLSEEQTALADPDKTSVLKLQVGVLGTRSLQRYLNHMAKSARASTTNGLSHMLKETTLALMRHPDCCISAYSCAYLTESINGGEMFDRLCMEERAKVREETLINEKNILWLNKEYIVVTLLVAIQGDHRPRMPSIKRSEDLRNALQKLESITSSQIRGVEVMWTPRAENGTLSEKELIEHYPHLVDIRIKEEFNVVDYTRSLYLVTYVQGSLFND